MRLTLMNEIESDRSMVQVFGGYNHNMRIDEAEWWDMQNLTSDGYPVMMTRPKYAQTTFTASGAHSINGLIAKDTLCYADGTKLYVDGAEVTGLTLEDSPKQLVSMGAYIIIFPDKKYVNTADLTDYGSLESTYTTIAEVHYSLCNAEGEDYTGVIASGSAPTDPADKMLWIDTSETPHSLKQFSVTTAVWVAIGTTYVKIASPNIASNFKQWDGVKVTGIDPEITQLSHLEGQTSVLYNAYHDPGDETVPRAEGVNDYIVMVGILDTSTQQSAPVTISRQLPLMDFVIESNNRLWGCRYGTNLNGEVVNEIYASKLGDPKNWNVFLGLSTDSYMASCGTDGQWTGAITHLGYPLFFKENVLHKVYGNFPSNFQIQTTPCRGVMKGAGQSLAIVDEVLYYKTRKGICAYDGSLPVDISTAMGRDRHAKLRENVTDPLRCGAIGCGHDSKYYLYMGGDQGWNLWVYDTRYRVWHKHDDSLAIKDMCSCRGVLYFAVAGTAAGTDRIWALGADDSQIAGHEDDFKWYAVSGMLGLTTPDQKTLIDMNIRMQAQPGEQVRVYAQYDYDNEDSISLDECELVTTIECRNLRAFNIPIRPHRCDHFRIIITGKGAVKIFSITKNLEIGSDIVG